MPSSSAATGQRALPDKTTGEAAAKAPKTVPRGGGTITRHDNTSPGSAASSTSPGSFSTSGKSSTYGGFGSSGMGSTGG
ncbi:hypothetical protein Q5741_15365 [Paenibacillus sp. JX-17]|uniref:Uncharacterized protein n=1 Tax=Paenibacillus lacisoli TaxID=3064525 RepID=A0ABT9CEU1_9BACL|nr:hypothetical protein [Paenibacillus sp. JX-17]MDO7907790.1 hypothetical protein [Paenibacillus sp. JX-17]